MNTRFAMRSRVAAIAVAAMALAAPDPASAQDTKAEVVGVIKGMFDALARGDTAAMRGYFVAEGRVTQTGTQQGKPFYRVNPIDAFLKSIGGAVAQGRKLEEKIAEPTVTIEDNLAHVWSRYDFFVDGAKSHCGVDSYHLVRTADGWKLLDIVDTQRRPCS